MAMASKAREALIDPLIDNNPITLQVLGICSALAVTTKMDTAMVMGLVRHRHQSRLGLGLQQRQTHRD
jgi:Na+-transporting NADH:ubiquinone oxidoreductase subunit NqrD